MPNNLIVRIILILLSVKSSWSARLECVRRIKASLEGLEIFWNAVSRGRSAEKGLGFMGAAEAAMKLSKKRKRFARSLRTKKSRPES
jgi:hypothetical protein